MNQLYAAVGEVSQRAPPAVHLALKALLVGVVCHLSIQVGHAFKFPPHDISALWPTSAILVSILVASPIRHWWVYLLAGYSTYAIDVARFGFLASDVLYNLADIIKVLIAAVGVRWLAGGLRAFDSLRGLVLYIAAAVVLAPVTSAFVAALAGAGESYWFYWRAWCMSEALAFLVLAPAILTWIAAARAAPRGVSLARFLEAGLLACGLIAISLVVFHGSTAAEGSIPVLVYLPLPFLLWAAVRFGPVGANTGLLAVAFLAISGVLQGRGPFGTSVPEGNVFPLQLFLIMLSLPLMFLAALIAERRERINVLRESEARFRSMADTAPVLVWMSGQDKLWSFFNKTWLDFTGRTLDKELGNGWSDGIHPEDLARCSATQVDAFDARARLRWSTACAGTMANTAGSWTTVCRASRRTGPLSDTSAVHTTSLSARLQSSMRNGTAWQSTRRSPSSDWWRSSRTDSSTSPLWYRRVHRCGATTDSRNARGRTCHAH